jgi:LmbE family N-acetylglucosaminyl deacetylase
MRHPPAHPLGQVIVSILDRIQRALVIAPHPDDEVLGCGGVIARMVDGGREVHIAIATRGEPPDYSAQDVSRLRAEAESAHRILGVTQSTFLDLPAAKLDQVPQAKINHAIRDLIERVAPDTLFLPFAGDIHRDHQLIFAAAMVAARPVSWTFPTRILAYETLSETNWGAPGILARFDPNLYISIDGFLDRKLEAFEQYRSQIKPFPHERSVEGLTALAKLRGATVHRPAAEAFIAVREIG